jgi:predicted ATPase
LFRRLATFTGEFTLREANIVGVDGPPDQAATSELLASLVSKSLIMTDARGSEPRFRLLATTRAYGIAKLVESGEFDLLPSRHAEHCHDKHERPRDRRRYGSGAREKATKEVRRETACGPRTRELSTLVQHGS